MSDSIIINADDFGLNQSCTTAICRSFAEGLITDTTMVANGTAFDQAVAAIKEKKLQGKIGIHFNLTEGEPLSTNISRLPAFVENGSFHGKINRLKPLSKEEKTAVYEELSVQVQRIKSAGVEIVHADSHHHIHTAVFLAPIFLKVCKENGIERIRIHRNIGSIAPMKRTIKNMFNRWLHSNGFRTTVFFGSMEDVKMVGIMDDLEIMVHPDYDKNGTLIDRVDEKDGFAVGERLTLPEGKLELKGYRDL